MDTLTDVEKSELLSLARKSIEFFLKNRKEPSAEDIGITVQENMSQVMGAFVTLHINGHLRGCIGEIIPRRALYKAVKEHAINAAFQDPRFRPLSEKEFSSIDIEISALTPPVEVPSFKDIIIGKHGILLQKGFYSAVFLPQVAPEQGWDLATTLSHLAMKAGLPSDGWKEGCHFQVFEAIVFGEKD